MNDPAPVRQPGFVGRDAEFAALTAALSAPPALVVVEGEAGVGKSRLVAEVLAARTPTSLSRASGSLVDDSKDILLFLDAYLSDKECDRSQKDFLKKIFDRAVMQFDSQENAPSGLSIRKWASFVERGPTMDSHSVCTRAAARAMKCARAATL